MIPKKIHYCWFGGNPKPEKAKKCIESWKKYCKDYELIEWNEENFNLDICPYVREAYDNKKYAFVTDYVRLYVLYKYGGIYMDTDVEVKQNLDKFLSEKAFSGFESTYDVPTGIMASVKELPIIKELLDYYKDRHFVDSEGNFDLVNNVVTITETMLKKGLKRNNKKQTIEGFTFYPFEYFCPLDYRDNKLKMTKNTYTIHWYAGSWLPKKDQLKLKLSHILYKNKFLKSILKKRFERNKKKND